jgi:hypothetical protein
MSSANHIELPDPLEEQFRLERHTEEFFKKRAQGATGNGLRWALDNAPDRPPDPGDEL